MWPGAPYWQSMYRHSNTNEIAYTPEDLLLFRESPFASWMERLTLENPDHGIAPDARAQARARAVMSSPRDKLNGAAGVSSLESLDWREFALITGTGGNSAAKPCRKHATGIFHAEGSDVSVIEWYMSEARRRAATLEAMRSGVEFIVNGQLALGPLSCSVNLLLCSDGVSELGNYLYIPCDTVPTESTHIAFHLSFAADLLSGIQGMLPPQMLIIRAGEEIVALQTEEHIHYFRAVKRRFIASQLSFRADRMPDPAESSHFGRWSQCAQDVIRQRLSAQESRAGAASPGQRAAGSKSRRQLIAEAVDVFTEAPGFGVPDPEPPGLEDVSVQVAGSSARQADAGRDATATPRESLVERDTPRANYAGDRNCAGG